MCFALLPVQLEVWIPILPSKALSSGVSTGWLSAYRRTCQSQRCLGVRRNERHCQQLCSRQAGSATAGALQGEGPEPGGRLGANMLVRRFGVTAQRSNKHYKRKAGPTPGPLAGLPVVLCAAIWRCKVIFCRVKAPRRAVLQGDPTCSCWGDGGLCPHSSVCLSALTEEGKAPQNSASSAAHSCPHSLSQGTADQHCPCQRHNPGKCCRAKLIPKINEIGICSKRWDAFRILLEQISSSSDQSHFILRCGWQTT